MNNWEDNALNAMGEVICFKYAYGEMTTVTKEQYKVLTEYIKKRKILYRSLAVFYKYTPIMIGIAYVITGLYVIFFMPDKLIRFICVPLFTFCTVSLLRRLINRERPYDKFNISPLFKYKAGKGRSFPSRHTASAFIIAMTCLYINTFCGVIILFMAIIVGMTRVLSGMHYMTDVFGAAMLTLLIAISSFF